VHAAYENELKKKTVTKCTAQKWTRNNKKLSCRRETACQLRISI